MVPPPPPPPSASASASASLHLHIYERAHAVPRHVRVNETRTLCTMVGSQGRWATTPSAARRPSQRPTSWARPGAVNSFRHRFCLFRSHFAAPCHPTHAIDHAACPTWCQWMLIGALRHAVRWQYAIHVFLLAYFFVSPSRYRAAVPPLIQHRTGVGWKDASFDDSASVAFPHDFSLPGNGESTGSRDYPYSELVDG